MDLVNVVIKAVIFLSGIIGMYVAYKLGIEHGYQEGREIGLFNGAEMGYAKGYRKAYEEMGARNEIELDVIFRENRAVIRGLESKLKIATEMLKRVERGT